MEWGSRWSDMSHLLKKFATRASNYPQRVFYKKQDLLSDDDFCARNSPTSQVSVSDFFFFFFWSVIQKFADLKYSQFFCFSYCFFRIRESFWKLKKILQKVFMNKLKLFFHQKFKSKNDDKRNLFLPKIIRVKLKISRFRI